MIENSTKEIKINLLTVKETAEVLRVSENTVRRLEQKGTIKAIRLGRKIMFSAEMLEQFVRDASERV